MLEHLKSRHFDLSLYPNAVVTDTELTLPLFHLTGEFAGYQVYNPSNPKQAKNPRDAKYFTYLTGSKAVWGLEVLNPKGGTLYLCEGVFDACRLHSAGFQAVACLSNNPVHLSTWFRCLPHTRVAVVQGDKAGQKLAKHGHRAVYLPEGKDVGDLTDEEFKKFFPAPNL